jgi:glycine C-acetyltransferase
MWTRLVALRGVSRGGRSLSVLTDIAKAQLEAVKAAGTYKRERIITSPQSSSIAVAGTSGQVLNFCANNYLGLASNPEIVKEAHHALDTHGFGLSSVRCVWCCFPELYEGLVFALLRVVLRAPVGSRFICGTQDLHKQLEKKIAQFHGTEDAILYASCFDANAGCKWTCARVR